MTRGLAGEERQLRRVLAAYLLAGDAIWLVPNAMGGNAVRLGALFGGPVLAAACSPAGPGSRSGSWPCSWPAASTGR